MPAPLGEGGNYKDKAAAPPPGGRDASPSMADGRVFVPVRTAPGASGSATAQAGAAPAAAPVAAVAPAIAATARPAAAPAAASAVSADAGQGPAAAVSQGKAQAQAQVVKLRRQSEGAPAPVVPDFCNIGVAMRTLVIAHLGLLAVFATQVHLWSQAVQVGSWGRLLLGFEGPLLLAMSCLCVLRKILNGMPQQVQWLAGIAIPVLLTMLMAAISVLFFRVPADVVLADSAPTAWQVAGRGLAAGLVAAAFFVYFRLRARALAPSFSEARLQALQARIRPHFLFNSLNTVLGLIRTNPRLAESTLENLADLFRVFMRDARELVPLDDEVLTCKEYLAIEKLRLAPRLDVAWDIEGMPGDALLPSLLLQPLLENAVHHGIEPRTETGVLNIRIRQVGDRVRVEVDNPISATVASRPGNQMALSNVRERLMLLYDTEAELRTGPQGDRYHVLLEFPYRKERRRRDVRRHFNPDR